MWNANVVVRKGAVLQKQSIKLFHKTRRRQEEFPKRAEPLHIYVCFLIVVQCIFLILFIHFGQALSYKG
jgi:hypothetical protein